LRPEPTSEDHAFDDDAFKADYRAWLQEKAEIERDQEQATEANAQLQREWEADVARFEQRKAELKVDDLEDAQDAVAGALSLAQQAAVVKAADNPALVFYALGKSPAKLAEVAKVKDIIKFAAAIAKVEGTVKVTKRRKGPALDRPQRGSGVLVSSDKKLAQLEKQADETGDRTELVRYRKELAERSKKK
jgi:flagellar hook-associated protein FlgK